MIPIKTKDEIKRMKEGGKRLTKVMEEVLKRIEPGVKLSELDQLAESFIEKKQGKPSFKMVPNYHWATCINVNHGVVHGIPNEYQLKNGDLVSLDIGFFYKGFHTDMARTVLVTKRSFSEIKNFPKKEMVVLETRSFLRTGERALRRSIKAAKLGNRVGHISKAIEKEIKKTGFSPIQTFTGHGVGKSLHEEPQIPCLLKGKIKQTPKLKPGMALAIEVIYSRGRPEVILRDDGWTVETKDKNLAGLFEDTVVVTAKGPLVLT